jgi:hypothetical protein
LRPEYVERLIDGFSQLSGQLDNIHTGFQDAGPAAAHAVNRWAVGNIRFGKECILFEPPEHRLEREEKAETKRQQRAERKRKNEAEARDAKGPNTTTSEGAEFDRGHVRRRSHRRRPRKVRRRSKAAPKKTIASTTTANTTQTSSECSGSNFVNDPLEIASGTIPECTQAISKVLTAEMAQAGSSICIAARLWAGDNGGTFPMNLSEFAPELGATAMLICPSDRARGPAKSWSTWTEANSSYSIVAPSLPETDTNSPYIRCSTCGTVGFVDGTVDDGSGRRQKSS